MALATTEKLLEQRQSDDVARVYEAYAKLKDAELNDTNKQDCLDSYEYLLSSVKGDIKVRQLLAGFIPQFFRWFGNISEKAINAQLDLCEDSEVNIRMAAIRGLQKICEGSPEHILRISDVLGQLLLTDQGPELRTVKTSYAALFQLDFEASIGPLFSQICQGDKQLRIRAIEFLREQIGAFLGGPLKKKQELQKVLVLEIRKLFEREETITLEEFRFFLSLLKRLSVFRSDKTLSSEFFVALIDKIITAMATAKNENAQLLLDQLLLAWKTLPKEASAHSSRLVPVLFDNVFPNWSSFSSTSRMALLHSAIEHQNFTPEMAKSYFCNLWKVVCSVAPNPIEDMCEIECFLFLLHRFAAQAPSLMKEHCGIFVPTGQPSDFRTDVIAKKDAFLSTMNLLNEKATSDTKNQAAAQNVVKMIAAFKKQRASYGAENIHLSWLPRKKEAQQPQQQGKGQTDAQNNNSKRGRSQEGATGNKKQKLSTPKQKQKQGEQPARNAQQQQQPKKKQKGQQPSQQKQTPQDQQSTQRKKKKKGQSQQQNQNQNQSVPQVQSAKKKKNVNVSMNKEAVARFVTRTVEAQPKKSVKKQQGQQQQQQQQGSRRKRKRNGEGGGGGGGAAQKRRSVRS